MDAMCPVCGRWAPMDRETGYCADEICPTCQRNGWDADNGGNVFNHHDQDESALVGRHADNHTKRGSR